MKKRFVTIAGAAVLFLILSWVALLPSGERVVVDNLSGYHPAISRLFPQGRLATPVRGERGWEQRVIAEPVYVTVRVPRRLQNVTVALTYRGDATPMRFGVLEAGGYALHEVPGGASNDARTATLTLSLERAVLNQGAYRFQLSAPELTRNQQTLVIEQLSFHFRGQPLRRQLFQNALQRWVSL